MQVNTHLTTTPLTFTHLRFDCLAQDDVHLGGHRAGNFLRGALGNVILHAICPLHPRPAKPTPEHAATCPACWLLTHEATPGRVHRVYSLVPPIPSIEIARAGERFSFFLTLFGEEGFRFLPYFVLAVPEMGRVGIGRGRGSFAVEAVWAVNPLLGKTQRMLAPGETTVQVPDNPVRWEDAAAATHGGLPTLRERDHLEVRFLTPTRLIEQKRLSKVPDFSVFFRRLLKRIDELGMQFGNLPHRRPPEDVAQLHALADQVRLVDVDTQWVELKTSSSRRRKTTYLSGFVGTARYRAPSWEALLPWLTFGQGVQVGKYVVKGNGVYELGLPTRYWQTAYQDLTGAKYANHSKSSGG